MVLGCKGARGQECKGARVQGCKGARVQGCKGARVRGSKGARVLGCKGARVQGLHLCGRQPYNEICNTNATQYNTDTLQIQDQ